MSRSGAFRHPVAVNYATALLNVAKRRGVMAALQEEARLMRDIFLHGGGRLRRFLESPQIATDVKLGLIGRLFAGRVDDLLRDYLGLLVRRHRIALACESLEAFEDLARADQGIRRGEVVTAVTLNFNQRIEMETVLERFTRSRLELEYAVDPEILGGVVFQTGDTLVDGSVRGRLSELRRRLEGARVI